MAADAIARDIEAQLAEAGDPQRAEQEQRYLKSSLRHFGASVPATRRIAKAALGGASAARPTTAAGLVTGAVGPAGARVPGGGGRAPRPARGPARAGDTRADRADAARVADVGTRRRPRGERRRAARRALPGLAGDARRVGGGRGLLDPALGAARAAAAARVAAGATSSASAATPMRCSRSGSSSSARRSDGCSATPRASARPGVRMAVPRAAVRVGRDGPRGRQVPRGRSSGTPS